MKRLKSKLKFNIVWIGIDGKPQVFKPYLHSVDGDWKIPIAGMKGVYEVWAGKNDRRIIKTENFTELPPTLKGRILVIADRYNYLSDSRPEINELLAENAKQRDTIEKLKMQLIVERAKQTDLKVFADLVKQAKKESQKQDKEIIFNPNQKMMGRRY